MPEKDGAEEKSTKSVVNKKQKQMMNTEEFSDRQRSDMKNILNKNFGSEDKSKETAGKLIKDKAKKDVERVQSGKQPNKSTPSTKLRRSSVDLNKYFGEEGYDIARDMGRVPKTKDKKDATSYPPSEEMKKLRKVNKGPSALERVKADIRKRGEKIMDVKKEELDLTQVAEAFGGYIVENINKPKFYSTKTEKKFQSSVEGKTLRKKFRRTEAAKKAAEKASKETQTASSAIDPSQQQFVQGGRYSQSKIPKEVRDPITGEPLTRDYDLPPKEQERQDQETKQTPEYQKAKAGAEQGVANPTKFTTDTRTQAEFDADEAERKRKRSEGKGDGRKAGRTKEERRTGQVTYQTFVNKPEVTGGQDRPTDTRSSVYIPKPEEIEKVKPKPDTQPETQPETKRQRNKRLRTAADQIISDIRTGKDKTVKTQTQMGDGQPPKPPKVTTSTGATGGGKEPSLVSKIAKFSKKNPATALLSFDALRKLIPSRSPFGVQGGRAGLRSAAR